MNNLVDSPVVKDSSDETFIHDVIEASKKLPVLVDFWAPWCGPCKSLGPNLEAEVKENSKKIRLVKIDIDKNPNIAGQLRVQSIPAVFAFSDGQPVDGFMGAQTPSQVKDFVKKIIDGFGPEDDALTKAIKKANNLFAEKDYVNAIEVFKQIIKQDINLPEAYVGLIKSLLNEKDLLQAQIASEEIPELIKSDATIKSVIAQIQLFEQTQSVGSLIELKNKLHLSPNDLDVKFDLALALIADEKFHEAIDILLQIVEIDPGWKDDKAKNQTIKILDALGSNSKEGRTGRRKLSSLIFS